MLHGTDWQLITGTLWTAHLYPEVSNQLPIHAA